MSSVCIDKYIGDEESKFKILAENSLQKMQDVAVSAEKKTCKES